MEGYLQKRSDGKLNSGRTVGNAFAKWDKRFFTIAVGSTKLCYYKERTDPRRGYPPSGQVDVLGANIDFPTQPGDLTFAIHTHARVLTLKASTGPEVDQWCSFLAAAAAPQQAPPNSQVTPLMPSLQKGTSSAGTMSAQRLKKFLPDTLPPPTTLPPPAKLNAAVVRTQLDASVPDSSDAQPTPMQGGLVTAKGMAAWHARSRERRPTTVFFGQAMRQARSGLALGALSEENETERESAVSIARSSHRNAPSMCKQVSWSVEARGSSAASSPASGAREWTKARDAVNAVHGMQVSRNRRTANARQVSCCSAQPTTRSSSRSVSRSCSRSIARSTDAFTNRWGHLSAAALGFTKEEEDAAIDLQRIYRGIVARQSLLEFILYNYSTGSLAEAQRMAAASLHKLDDAASPIPLGCETSAFAVFGAEVHAYMSFVERACRCFFLCFLLSLAMIFNNLEGSDMGEKSNGFNQMSLGNLSRLKISSAVLELVISGVLVNFLFRARKAQLREGAKAEENEITPADFSVLIKGLPHDTTDAARVSAFLGGLGVNTDDIVAVTLSMNVRELILLLRARSAAKCEENALLARRYQLRQQMNQHRHRAISAATGEMEDAVHSYDKSPVCSSTRNSAAAADAAPSSRGRAPSVLVSLQMRSIQSQIEAAQSKLDAFEEEKKKLLARHYECTGIAFVTFNTEQAANDCIHALNEQDTREKTGPLTAEAFTGRKLTAERPPEPEDVYWEELQFTGKELVQGQLGACAIILVVALLGTTVIAAANYGMGPVMETAESVWVRLGMQAGFTSMIILGNIFIFILTPHLANSTEHHHTFGSKQVSCFFKMFCFQVFNTVVASTVFFFWASPTRHSWYAYGAAMVFNVMIGDLFVIQVFLDWLQPAVLVARWVLAPRAKTQREMNELYACKADIYVAFRLQLMAKFLTVTLIYSSALPLAYGLAALFLWLAQWIDRINLLRRLQPPPRSPASLIGVLLCGVLPVAVALHLICAFMFYWSELSIMLSDPLCEGEVFDGLRSGISGVLAGMGGVLGSAPPVIYGPDGVPCQTAFSLWEAYTSVGVVALSAAVWGTCLIVYIVIETRRRVERGMHVIDEGDESIVASFLDMGFAEGEAGQDLLRQTSEHRSSAFGRSSSHMSTNMYVPPLPPSVLQSLHTISQANKSPPLKPTNGTKTGGHHEML